MKSGARIGLAVGLGYLLGRRRKLRTALTLAGAVAVGRASRDPNGLKSLGSSILGASPQLSNLGKLGGPLASAGRAAATAAASSGIDAVGGKLRGKADALRGRAAASAPDGGEQEQESGAAEESGGGQASGGGQSGGGRRSGGKQRSGGDQRSDDSGTDQQRGR